jgi:hypothetical protein
MYQGSRGARIVSMNRSESGSDVGQETHQKEYHHELL